MTAPLTPETALAGIDDLGVSTASAHEHPVPCQVKQVDRRAGQHADAVQGFERGWLVNAILSRHYTRLRDAALDDLGAGVRGRTLQVACVPGDLTPCLQRRLVSDAHLDVVDIRPNQLHNLAARLSPDERVCLMRGDPAALAGADARYDQVLLFFLLHRQPAAVRCATLTEAMRVVRPGGRVVVVDYHQPSGWHPMRALMLLLRRLEPHAFDLWRHEVIDFIPVHARPALLTKRTYFGGLYQKLVLVR
jgi:SAM-dependent methyltransferase